MKVPLNLSLSHAYLMWIGNHTEFHISNLVISNYVLGSTNMNFSHNPTIDMLLFSYWGKYNLSTCGLAHLQVTYM